MQLTYSRKAWSKSSWQSVLPWGCGAYAARNGLDAFIVSQLCLDPDAIVRGVERLRARGVAVPLRVGVAGKSAVDLGRDPGRRPR